MSTTTFADVQEGFFTRLRKSVNIRFMMFLDASVPHFILRWLFCLIVYGLYAFRVYLIEGFYIISYGLGIYELNLLIGFLSPRDDLELDTGATLPTNDHEDFRPFERRLPEFDFWKSSTRAVLVAITCTFFDFLDIPVFWPILLLYFIILFVLTMKRQIKHMIKHRYIPFTYGKKTYKGANAITKKEAPQLKRIRPNRPMIRSLPKTGHEMGGMRRVQKD